MKNKLIMVALAAFTFLGVQLAQAKQNVYVFDMSALADQNWELIGEAQDSSGNLLGTFDVAESGDQGSTLSVDLYGEILIVVVPDGETLAPSKGWIFSDSLCGQLLESDRPGNWLYDDNGDSTTIGQFDPVYP